MQILRKLVRTLVWPWPLYYVIAAIFQRALPLDSAVVVNAILADQFSSPRGRVYPTLAARWRLIVTFDPCHTVEQKNEINFPNCQIKSIKWRHGLRNVDEYGVEISWDPRVHVNNTVTARLNNVAFSRLLEGHDGPVGRR